MAAPRVTGARRDEATLSRRERPAAERAAELSEEPGRRSHRRLLPQPAARDEERERRRRLDRRRVAARFASHDEALDVVRQLRAAPARALVERGAEAP